MLLLLLLPPLLPLVLPITVCDPPLQLDLGRVPPRVGGIKVYSPEKGGRDPDELMADVDVEYRGDMDVGIAILGVSASVKDVHVKGTVRITLRYVPFQILFLCQMDASDAQFSNFRP